MTASDPQDASRTRPETPLAGSGPLSSTAAVVISAALLVAVVAWRARYGISFFDDGYYASITLRLALGARPFTDEMTAQVLGFLIPAMIAKAWHALFGTYGIVLALRLAYVAAASAVGVFVYRSLRPEHPAAASFVAASVPLIAVPYNIIGLSYNTTALLAFTLAWALMFRAVRDDRRGLALGAGIAAAVGTISYPPLVVGALAMFVTCMALKEARRFVLPALAGAAVTLAVFATWLFSVTSIADARAALTYSSHVLDEASVARERALRVVMQFWTSLLTPWLIPMWSLVVAACVPRLGSARVRMAALLVPLAAFVPSAVVLVRGPLTPIPPFAALGGAYLIVMTAGLLVPALLWTLREGGQDARLAMWLALPLALANTTAAAYFTSAGWQWAVPVIGLAPLLVVLLAGWYRMSAQGAPTGRGVDSGTAATVTGALVLGALLVLLYATAFKDYAPSELDHGLTEPSVAGILTRKEQAGRIAELGDAGRRWVEPGEGVLFVHGQFGYMVVDARMVTNAVWLATGPSDAETLAYFERTGEWPDAVFVSSSLMGSLDEEAVRADPLLSYLADEYDRVDEMGGFVIYRRR